MERAGTSPVPKQQTTVSSRVFGIIFDDFPRVDHVSNFCRADQTLRPGHLLHSMGKEQDFSGGCLADVLQNGVMRFHVGRF
jgi:hypothetical protein